MVKKLLFAFSIILSASSYAQSTFNKVHTSGFISGNYISNSAKLLDINNDGYTDLYFGNRGYDFFYHLNYYILGKSDGSFNTTLYTDGDYDLAQKNDVDYVDINNDGYNDRIYVDNDYSPSRLIINTLDSKGVTLQTIFFSGVSIYKIHDFNKDGYKDVIINHDGKVNVHINNTDETFTNALEISDAGTVVNIEFFDIDSNGTDDILLVNNSSKVITATLNSDISILEKLSYSVSRLASVTDVKFEDVNKDGNLDIYYKKNNEVGLIMFEDETYVFKNSFSLSNSSTSKLQVADLNNDGRKEIITTRAVIQAGELYDYNNYIVVLYLNDDYTFTKDEFLTGDKRAQLNTVLVHDLNKDGLLDLIAINTIDTYVKTEDVTIYYEDEDYYDTVTDYFEYFNGVTRYTLLINQGDPLSNSKVIITGNHLNGTNILHWNNIDSENASLEYSNDGKVYQDLFKINENHQSFSHVINSGNIHYYRIKLVQNDDINYSNVIKLNSLKTNSFTLYPNPANDYINIQSDDIINQSIQYKILDHSGKVILADKFTNNGRINISELSQGTYYLLINDSIERFIKL